MLLIILILRACILVASDTFSLYVYTTISVAELLVDTLLEMDTGTVQPPVGRSNPDLAMSTSLLTALI